ncbi:hypothetical protein ISN44_As03g013510 [Arabidopsis suecica]|uniref:Transmembrane protein n=1 Tax=Arabidopsis suecica TaxID=45249 RepID=A0A8T2F449_ARASU|nr:hypothetical protein ISN44_As03g013510 [Arabidopsis suecica]
MSLKFILIALLLLLCITFSNSTVVPFSKNRKIKEEEEEEEGREIGIHKGKKNTVKVSRSPPAKGWICCND